MKYAILLLLPFIHSALPCQYPVYQYGVDNNAKQEILYRHNKYRACIAQGGGSQPCQEQGVSQSQPQGSDIQEMIWDDQLASVAQNWANRCEYGHNPDRSQGGEYAGENIYQSGTTDLSSSNPNWSNSIKGWFDEYRDYNYNSNSSPNGKQVGHYTQVVWAKTYKIGCGFIAYKQDGWMQRYYVCDYRPGGNIQGQKPYRAGSPGSACSRQSNSYRGLCAPGGS